MPNTIDTLLKRKLVKLLLGLASVGFSVYCIMDFASMARNSHTQQLLREMNAINSNIQKLPPGIPRGEEFLRRLKTLDPGLAPAEVKQALHDYTAAAEDSLQAVKAGRDAAQFETAMAEAKQRLADCFSKYR